MGTESEQLKRDIEETRRGLGDDVDALSDKVSPSKVVGRRVDAAKEGVAGLKDKVLGAAHDKLPSGSGSEDSDGGIKQSAAGAAGSVKSSAEGNPLAAGVVAFGLGFLLSSLLPATDAETHAASALADKAQDNVGPVKEKLTGAAHDLTESLKGPAQEAASAVKSSATDAAANVKENATS